MGNISNIRTVAATGSTNDDVAALARDGAREGIWLRAERQSGGRGRQGRTWESPPGNLHASTLVRLRESDPPAATLALVAGVALHEVASLHAPGLQLKWPNDLVVIPSRNGEGDHAAKRHGGGAPARPLPADRPARADPQSAALPGAGDGGGRPAKLAGILLEREGAAVVAGFGVNLATSPELPDRPAASLAGLTGAAPDPQIFLETLAEAFDRWLDRWRREGLGPVRRRWLESAHPVGTALVTAEGAGLFDGLDESGALRLRLADGSLRIVHAGDVFLLDRD